MARKISSKISAHIIGLMVIIFGIYLVLINAPNYVGYVVSLLGIALTLKPNAVKHLAYHNEKLKVLSAPKERLRKSKRNRP